MKITITGASGTMGRMLLKTVIAHPDAILHGATIHPNEPLAGTDAGRLIGADDTGILLTSDPLAAIADADAVIDFTAPDASLEHARICANSDVAYILGTTGFTPEQSQQIDLCQHHIPLLRAANFSLGVNLLLNLAQQMAETLPIDYDIEILEMHHNRKVDAPSGTALALGTACAKGRGAHDLTAQQAMMLPPHHDTSDKRAAGKIGYATLRGGTVIGDHEVIFAGTDERITIGHQAQSKEIFAKGAVHAALWLKGKPAGNYSMQDVLRLSADEK